MKKSKEEIAILQRYLSDILDEIVYITENIEEPTITAESINDILTYIVDWGYEYYSNLIKEEKENKNNDKQ